jgi:hypothetical protein
MDEQKETLGSTAGETAGHAGSDVSGGEMTAPQSADAMLRRTLGDRADEGDMGAQQQMGQVEVQNDKLKPAAGHPESGLPTNPTSSENSGGSDAGATNPNAAE